MAGDFIYVPPYVPHQEINGSPNEICEAVVVRSGQEPVVINLDVETPEPASAGHPGMPFHPRGWHHCWSCDGMEPIARIFLVLALIQLHSSLAGGNSGQGWTDDVLVPVPPLDPDAALDADAPLDPVARLHP
jgi:hypothetical protein